MPTAHRIKRGLAIVPENRRLFGPMTVLENLEMGAYLRPKADLKAEFERVYELFPLLYERRTQLAGTMSGGEQQMVAMGRALMSQPKLLLMDEPSMGLAPVLVERSFEIIKQVNEAGVAMLVVEQNANVSLSIADRGYVLSTGRVVLEGKAADLLAERGAPQGVPGPLMGVVSPDRAGPAAARIGARSRDAAPRGRRESRGRRRGPRRPALRLRGQRPARGGGARDGLGRVAARGRRGESRGRRRRRLARSGHARRRDRPPRSDGRARADRRDRRRRARQGDRQPLVPGVVRPSQRLDARDDVRRLRPAGQGAVALPPLRRDRLDLAWSRPVSPRRRRRAARRTAVRSGSRRARCTSSRTRAPIASLPCSGSSPRPGARRPHT